MAKMWAALAGLFEALTELVNVATEKTRKENENDAP